MTEPSFRHVPVMLGEVVDVMTAVPPGVVIDATVGGGGHAAALLERRPDIRLLGLDRDTEALAAAHAALERFGDRVTLRKARFDALVETAEEVAMGRTLEGITGGLFDLGVSSPQFDHAERGFSYRHDGPLDMRMDRTQSRTA